MCALEGRNLRRSTLLIVGATGDVGSGCARCLAHGVKRVLLHARNLERLRRLAAELEADGVQGGDRDRSPAILRAGRRRDLRSKSGIPFASIRPHRTRRNYL